MRALVVSSEHAGARFRTALDLREGALGFGDNKMRDIRLCFRRQVRQLPVAIVFVLRRLAFALLANRHQGRPAQVIGRSVRVGRGVNLALGGGAAPPRPIDAEKRIAFEEIDRGDAKAMNFDERMSGPVSDYGKDAIEPRLLYVPGHILGGRNADIRFAITQHPFQPTELFALMERGDSVPQAGGLHRLEIGVGLSAGNFDFLERAWAFERTRGAAERTRDHVQSYVAVQQVLVAFHELDIGWQIDDLATSPRGKSAAVQHHAN